VEQDQDQPDRGRRNFLKHAGTAALLGAPLPAPAAKPAYQPSFFTPAEWAFVTAACARLIPEDELGPGAVQAGVPDYIDRQMATPWADGGLWYMQGPFLAAKPEFGYQSALTPKQSYRLGIKAIEALCQAAAGKPFAALDAAQQDDMLKRIEQGTLTSPDLSLKSFFALLLKNTREGFFGDPVYGGNRNMAGWRLIGHPGARADYLEWVGEAKPYPYGPVDLSGKRG
jgi:gluconate 2-dehydrogenase gamma chain